MSKRKKSKRPGFKSPHRPLTTPSPPESAPPQNPPQPAPEETPAPASPPPAAEPDHPEERPPDHQQPQTAPPAAPSSPDSPLPPPELLQRIKTLEKRLVTLQKKYSDRLINDALHAAYLAQGGLPSAAATAVLALRAAHPHTFHFDDQGDIRLTKPDGSDLRDDDGLPFTPQTFLRRWLAANPNFFNRDHRAGSGAAPSNPPRLSDHEILRQIRSASSPEEILKLAASLGLK